ncbi:MAG: flagellar protein FlaG, partial [Deltaproteobacteria bacterium]|nr:flagellar protein FlaG [Deltaproteobacteria bacterium]
NIDIAFSTYGKKNKNISVVVSEKETGKLIREIPPEELQQLHVKIKELAGMIFNGLA